MLLKRIFILISVFSTHLAISCDFTSVSLVNSYQNIGTGEYFYTVEVCAGIQTNWGTTDSIILDGDVNILSTSTPYIQSDYEYCSVAMSFTGGGCEVVVMGQPPAGGTVEKASVKANASISGGNLHYIPNNSSDWLAPDDLTGSCVDCDNSNAVCWYISFSTGFNQLTTLQLLGTENGQCPDEVISIGVPPICALPPTPVGMPADTAEVGSIDTVKVISPDSNYTYNWYGPNNFAFIENNAGTLIIDSVIFGENYYKVEAVDSNGCVSAQDTVLLTGVPIQGYLLINEASQGQGGKKEFVELVVEGPPCTLVDIRKWIIDDNNGFISGAGGSGYGVDDGANRFADVTFWAQVPVGTVILIYNDQDQNSNIPGQDTMLFDGNSTLVLGLSSTLFERNQTLPGVLDSTYADTGWVSGGDWNLQVMDNSNDGFQTINPNNLNTFYHSIGWGNNNQADVFVTSGSVSAKTSFFNNSVDDDIRNVVNWAVESAGSFETPAMANDTLNQVWIDSIRGGCDFENCPDTVYELYKFVCPGETLTVHGQSVTTGGVYLDTFATTGCDSVSKVVVIYSPGISIDNISSSDLSCNNTSDGVILVSASGGLGSLKYSMDQVNYGTSSFFSGLEYGIKKVYIKDSIGCIDSTSGILIDSSQSVNVTINTVNSDCGLSNGVASVSISGGVSPYHVTWSTGDTNLILNNLSSGSYGVLVSDNAGCSTNALFNINDNGAPDVSSNVTPISCFGNKDGAIDLTVLGGSPPYSISWSNGLESEDITNLSGGSYDVSVEDIDGCLISKTIEVFEPNELKGIVNSTDAGCGLTNGQALLNIKGGTPGYTISWSTGSDSLEEFNLGAGSYSVVVRDTNNCYDSTIYTISEAGAPVITVNSISAASCGSPSGYVDVSITGGTLPYSSVLWSNGYLGEDINGVEAGNYVLTVTDSGGCQGLLNVEVPSSDPFAQAICLVTVDDSSSSNLVVWDKSNVSSDVVSFNIYRETTASNVYQVIASIPVDSLSEYNDLLANPKVKSWKYKISAVDSCGNESNISARHKTIHLVLSKFGNDNYLSWDHYEGFNFLTYYIWREESGTGWVLFDSVASTATSYTDIAPTASVKGYFVEARSPQKCTSTKATTYETTRSNRENTEIGIDTLIADFSSDFQFIIEGDTVVFSDISQGNVEERNWLFEGGNPPVSQDSVVPVVYDTSGSYFVQLKVSNALLADTLRRTSYIVVNPNGIKSLELKSLNLYPNPSDGIYNLKLERSNQEVLKVKVSNIQGKLLQSEILNPGVISMELNLSNYETGAYILTIQSSSEIYNFKLLKK